MTPDASCEAWTIVRVFGRTFERSFVIVVEACVVVETMSDFAVTTAFAWTPESVRFASTADGWPAVTLIVFVSGLEALERERDRVVAGGERLEREARRSPTSTVVRVPWSVGALAVTVTPGRAAFSFSTVPVRLPVVRPWPSAGVAPTTTTRSKSEEPDEPVFCHAASFLLRIDCD